MILFPAIDLKDGRCVRLRRGDMAAATVYPPSPAAQAKASPITASPIFMSSISTVPWPAGRSMARRLRRSFRRSPSRSSSAAASAIWRRSQAGSIGVTRVILGTAASRDPDLVRDACRAFPGRVAVGIDSRDGTVAVEGWARSLAISAVELARRQSDLGVAAIIHTDIARDGVLEGLNIDATLAMARSTSVPVIASGGLASLADIERLAEPDCAILEGAICGRALYEGRIDPAAALAILRSGERRGNA